MDFISNQAPQVKEMLEAIGVSQVSELFVAVPDKIKAAAPERDDGISEFEGIRHMEGLAAANTFHQLSNYLGAGAYEHHVPALVAAICQKSEFLTAYTPYQAEASQGQLQSIFEFQSALCALTGMDVANASVYDGASACAEGLLMALRSRKGRRKILVSELLHPHYRQVCAQYLSNQSVEIVVLPHAGSGKVDLEQYRAVLDETVACILLAYPNFFGVVDDIKALSAKAKAAGALTVVCANPLAYGLFADAGALGADIAVGDCQPFGLPLQFGGPYAGYVACREELVRQLPGRLVGETVDTEGKRGFVLTLQAREQHIRRDKATSNICTNQALAALASLIAILWYGKEGVRQLALTNYQRASYLKHRLSAVKGISLYSTAETFNEFAVRLECPVDSALEHFRSRRIAAGLKLERFFPEMKQYLLIAVTETKSKEQLDQYVQAAETLPS